MSFLTLEKGIPNFAKAVISLWFRVPKQSIDAAHEQTPLPDIQYTEPLLQCIPLLTFGKLQKGLGLGADQGNITIGGATIVDTVGFSVHFPEYPLAPCHIAIDCSGNNPRLQFNIQMDTVAVGTGLYTSATATSVSAVTGDVGDLFLQSKILGSGVMSHAETRHGVGFDYVEPYFDTYSLRDLSGQYMSESPEYFFVSTPHKIESDQWHHLLLSFDVSRIITTKGPPYVEREDRLSNYFANGAEGVTDHAMLWYAIDDVDYRGRATEAEFQMFADVNAEGNLNKGFLHRLGPFSVDYGQHTEPNVTEGIAVGTPTMNGAKEGDPNGILTRRAWDVSTSGNNLEYNLKLPSDTYDYLPTPIPTEDEMGLPASARYKDNVYKVEMAEFQLFTGVTLDTEVELNRRAFVDVNGEPVSVYKKRDPTDPASTSGSIELLGKQPDILLHGSGNWQSGKNTGTTGFEIIAGLETILPSGQFTPTAEIDKYKPEPALEHPTA